MAKQYSSPPPMTIDPKKTYTATIDTSEGAINVELYPQDAPGHVNSFVFLAREGFYEGSIFHRVIPGFMIQGGDPTGTGTGGPGYKLKAEFNPRSHKRGVLSMARTSDPNSAGTQFFICVADARFLDNQYTAFGRVADDESLKTAQAIGKVRTGANDRPVEDVKIKKATVTESPK